MRNLTVESSKDGFECDTDMQEKAKARLCELAPAARGSQEAGFTQPSLHLSLHFCILFIFRTEMGTMFEF